MTSSQILLKLRRYVSPTLQQNEELSIYKIFKPFYLTLTFLGLFPYSVTYNKSRERLNIIANSIFINTLCAACYATISSVFCVIHIRYLFSTKEENSLTDVLLTQMNYLLEIGMLVFYCIVAYICTFLNRFRYVKILNAVCAIWTDPKSSNQNEIMKRLRFQVNVVALGSTIAVAILHICVNSSRDEGLWKVVLVTFTGVFPSMIQTIVMAFHYILVMMVVSILTDVNEQLVKLTKRRKTTEEMYMEVEMRRVNFSLRQIEQTYTKAYEIKCDINEAFQANLLVSIIQCFHCIVSEGYTIYHGIMERLFTFHNILNCTFWIALQLLKVYSLSYSGKVLKNKVTKIGQTLHAIPTEKQDGKTFMEIQHFTTMMNYQEFILTVYGYFSLDATLMSAMIANVTMYLIILIQFDKSPTPTTLNIF